jgi:hypothetical protein
MEKATLKYSDPLMEVILKIQLKRSANDKHDQKDRVVPVLNKNQLFI